jgi:hypothetical protein
LAACGLFDLPITSFCFAIFQLLSSGKAPDYGAEIRDFKQFLACQKLLEPLLCHFCWRQTSANIVVVTNIASDTGSPRPRVKTYSTNNPTAPAQPIKKRQRQPK